MHQWKRTPRKEDDRSLQLLHQHLLPPPTLPRRLAILLQLHLTSLRGHVVLGFLRRWLLGRFAVACGGFDAIEFIEVGHVVDQIVS